MKVSAWRWTLTGIVSGAALAALHAGGARQDGACGPEAQAARAGAAAPAARVARAAAGEAARLRRAAAGVRTELRGRIRSDLQPGRPMFGPPVETEASPEFAAVRAELDGARRRARAAAPCAAPADAAAIR